MSQTVLITGGTGVLGRRLTQILQARDYQVTFLSRSAAGPAIPNVRIYQWNVPKGHIDPQAIATADHIIHLAGAGVADERWTDARKKEITDSRIHSTELLASALRGSKHHVRSFVSTSAIGYYGGDNGDRPLVESSPAGSDFLAQITRLWERAVDQVAELGIRTVKIRTGVVLALTGGALPKLMQPIKLGAGAPLASGQQYVSWIHIDDICRIFAQALADERWQGVYNGVAPGPVTNEALTREIAKVIGKPLILPNIPAFVIKLMLGEMAIAVLGSSFVRNKRIQDETNFSYEYPRLHDALENLLNG